MTAIRDRVVVILLLDTSYDSGCEHRCSQQQPELRGDNLSLRVLSMSGVCLVLHVLGGYQKEEWAF